MKFVVLLLVISLALNVLLAKTVARLENYHYASQFSMCGDASLSDGIAKMVEREKCLNAKETRENMWWHLYYAVREQVWG